MATDPNNNPPTSPLVTSSRGRTKRPTWTRDAVGYRHALDEQRRLFDHITDTTNALDQKFQSLLNAASLVISLASVVQIGNVIQVGAWTIWTVLLVVLMFIALVAYVCMVAIILYGMRSSSLGEDNYLEPVDRDWATIKQRYRRVVEERALGYTIRNYLLATRENEKLVRRKMQNLKWAIGLFVITVSVTALSVIVGVVAQASTSGR